MNQNRQKLNFFGNRSEYQQEVNISFQNDQKLFSNEVADIF